MRVEIERVLLVQDGFPRELLAHRLVEVLHAHLVGCKEQQRVAVEAGRAAARLEDSLRGRPGGAPCLLTVGMLGREDDEARVAVVRYVGARAWQRVDPAKIASLAQVGAQPPVQLLGHLVTVTFQLFGAILGKLGYRRLGGVPEARPVLVQVGCRRGCGPQVWLRTPP